jgi:hypothetical protein
MRIPDDPQGRRSVCARELDATFDQQAPNASAPELWLDKQRVKIRVSIFAADHSGHTHDNSIRVRDEDVTGGDLLARHFDRVRIREQGFPIPWIVQRGAALQRLERLVLGHDSRAGTKVTRHWDILRTRSTSSQYKWSPLLDAGCRAGGSARRSKRRAKSIDAAEGWLGW